VERRRGADDLQLEFDADRIARRNLLRDHGRRQDLLDPWFSRQRLQHVQLDQIARALDVGFAHQLVVTRTVVGVAEGGEFAAAGRVWGGLATACCSASSSATTSRSRAWARPTRRMLARSASSKKPALSA